MTDQARLPEPEQHTLALGEATAHAWLYRASRPAAPCILVFPALGTPARPYRFLAQALQAQGVHCLTADWRGLASSSVRASRHSDWSYLDLVDGEAEAMWSLARAQLPDSNLHSLGHSLGGQVALLHSARQPQQSGESLILVASASPYHRGYPFPYRLGVYAFAWLTRLMVGCLGVFRGDWVDFGGRQGGSLMREWSRFARTNQLDALGASRWNADQALLNVERPILGIDMAGDRLAPASGLRQLTRRIGGAHHFVHLDRLPSGAIPGHFAWMREPAPVVELILRHLSPCTNEPAIR